MAKYRLTSPDGQRYEVTAPDDATEDQVWDYFRGQLGQQQPADYGRIKRNVGRMIEQNAPESDIDDYISSEGVTADQLRNATGPQKQYQREVRQEAARRQQAGGLESVGRQQSSLDYFPFFGAFPQATAAGRVGFKKLLNPNTTDFGDEYGRERDVIREQLRQKRDEMGWSNLPLDIATGMTAAPARGVAMLPEAISYGRGLFNAAKVAAPMGAAYGFNEETGDLGAKLSNAAEHGAGAAVTAPLVKMGIDVTGATVRGGRNLMRYLYGGDPASKQRQAAIADDFRQAGIEPPPAAVADNPTLRVTSRGVAGSFVGQPVQQDIQRAVGEVEQGIRNTISGGRQLPSPADFGAEVQANLRRNINDHTIPSRDLDAMTPDALEAVATSGRESYPTTFGARYRQAEQMPVEGFGTAADVRSNFMAAPGAGRPTHTWIELDRMAREARAAGLMKGWKDQDFNDPKFWDLLNRRYGGEVGGLLRSEWDRHLHRQVNLQIPGLRDQRTMVRRVLQDAEAGNSNLRPDAITSLRRLHGAMTQDLSETLAGAGRGGPEAALRYGATDADYRRHVEEVARPLRRLFGENVNPDQAYRRLFEATQRGSEDTRLLQRFYETIRRGQGGPSAGFNQGARATRALLANAMEGGMQGFVRSWNNLSPEARRIMQDGSAMRSTFDQLDRYARLSQRLEPFARINRGTNVLRMSNLHLMGWIIHNLPTALAVGGGTHLAARFMTSPRYLRWLTTMPMVGTRGSQSTLASHLDRLRAIAANDSEMGPHVLSALKEVLGAATAQAGEHYAEPTPEERGFLAPVMRPRGSAQYEPGVPGIIKHPFDAARRLLSAETQYQPGTEDEGGVKDALQAAGMSAGGMLAGRPANSLAAGFSRRLPLDKASRTERAASQGYDTSEPLYHGTTGGFFRRFDLSRAPKEEQAVWLTPHPEVAGRFAQFRADGWDATSVMPLHVRGKQKLVDRAYLEREYGAELARRAKDDPDFINPLDTKGGTIGWSQDLFRRELERARNEGFDSVRFARVDEGMGPPADQIAVFDRANIRSTSARFDPRRRHSGNLLSEDPTSAAALAPLLKAQDEERDYPGNISFRPGRH